MMFHMKDHRLYRVKVKVTFKGHGHMTDFSRLAFSQQSVDFHKNNLAQQLYIHERGRTVCLMSRSKFPSVGSEKGSCNSLLLIYTLNISPFRN